MLCYVISEYDYELAKSIKIKHKPEIVFVGRTTIEGAKQVSNTLPCENKIRVDGKCIYIICK